MKISDIKSLILGASYENDIEVLENIYEYVGNCKMNGYLGSSVLSISYDDDGKVEFDSCFDGEDYVVESTGVVLSETVIIKQKQLGDDASYQLYSWKKDGSCYTCILVANEKVLQTLYQALKKIECPFLGENIYQIFNEINISLEEVIEIKINQEVVQQSIDIQDVVENYQEPSVSEIEILSIA